MLLMVSKVEYVMLFIDNNKANNKYMIDYDKNKKSLYLKYWGIYNLYGWVVSQKLPLGSLSRLKLHLNLVKIL